MVIQNGPPFFALLHPIPDYFFFELTNDIFRNISTGNSENLIEAETVDT